jgi:hypothetical protein
MYIKIKNEHLLNTYYLITGKTFGLRHDIFLEYLTAEIGFGEGEILIIIVWYDRGWLSRSRTFER